MTVAGPFGKRDFSNQCGLDPMSIARNVRCLGKGIFDCFYFFQLRLQIAKGFIAVSRADIACIPQLFIFVIDADQKRAEP